MITEELIQIRRRIIYLSYSNGSTMDKYQALMNEQKNLQSLLANNPTLLKRKGIKSEYFGDYIMKGENSEQKKAYCEILKNEITAAIAEIIYI